MTCHCKCYRSDTGIKVFTDAYFSDGRPGTDLEETDNQECETGHGCRNLIPECKFNIIVIQGEYREKVWECLRI